MQIYLVGGAVRDELLNYPTDEHDYVVVGASPGELLEQGYESVGKDFPVFLHPKTKEEYALARTERKTAPGYQGFSFNTEQTVTLEEDLGRRDLTINAIAKNDAGEYVDPFNGKADLEKRVLRHVSDAFREDPVRILRTARFYARYFHLGFHIADETIRLMHAMVKAGEADHLVSERVWKEWERALTERHPHKFLEALHACGALNVVAPSLATLIETYQPTPTAALESNPVVLPQASSSSLVPEVSFASMWMTLNEKDTDQHLTLAKQFFNKIKTPKLFSELTGLVIKHGRACINALSLNGIQLLNLFQSCDAIRRPERFSLLLDTCDAWATVNEPESQLNRTLLLEGLQRISKVNPQSLDDPNLKGAALGEAIAEKRAEVLQALKNEYK